MRRVVKSPERWDRIRALAESWATRCRPAPTRSALAAFLARRKAADPATFPDLSTASSDCSAAASTSSIRRARSRRGISGWRCSDYTHSTAPNRRYPDLVTQRLVKAALAGHPVAVQRRRARRLATHCTQQEDAANKVERQVRKSAAAMVVQSRVGETFDAIVTGASTKGTFVRVMAPPIEGKLSAAQPGLDVGDRLRVRLSGVNVDRGFIDFRQA